MKQLKVLNSVKYNELHSGGTFPRQFLQKFDYASIRNKLIF